ncbi:hypothetical protein ACI513_05505 [Chryseobacterium sp. M5]|uniref:hypothetical protein n=1 Tax=Chryseobacterium sp. M5 TaxID=3379128 RepID=UPI003857EF17
MFVKLIQEFTENIEGLNEFVNSIEPLLIEKQSKFINENSSLFIPLLQAIGNKKNGIKDEIEVEIVSGKSKTHYNFSSKQFDENFYEVFNKFNRNDNHIKLLYKNSLISLLSSVEWFFSQILHTYYNKFPNASGIKKKSLTFEELKRFESIEEAEKYLIDQKIEGILRSSFNDWLELLIKEFSLKINLLISEKDEINEIYQRRNLLVHNGGLVNTIYLSKVEKKYAENLTLSDRIDVDSKYLENSISKLHINFLLLTTELWQKIEPESPYILTILVQTSYQYFSDKKYSIALQVCKYIEEYKSDNDEVKTFNKILLSFIFIKLDLETEAQEIIKNINITNSNSFSKLGYFSLVNDTEKFLTELPIAIKKGEFLLDFLDENPLFENISKNIDIQNFLNK